MGETLGKRGVALGERGAFSILERIDVGETAWVRERVAVEIAFSILERIDVGETIPAIRGRFVRRLFFQYPRTDRRG